LEDTPAVRCRSGYFERGYDDLGTHGTFFHDDLDAYCDQVVISQIMVFPDGTIKPVVDIIRCEK
jgi:hypothetical protein